jgi:hypothetical protein
MTAEGEARNFAISRRDAPEVCMNDAAQRNQRAQGNAGCPLHPQPLCIGSKHRVVTTGTRDTRHSLRNGFNGFLRALPGDEFFFVTVISRLRFV